MNLIKNNNKFSEIVSVKEIPRKVYFYLKAINNRKLFNNLTLLMSIC